MAFDTKRAAELILKIDEAQLELNAMTNGPSLDTRPEQPAKRPYNKKSNGQEKSPAEAELLMTQQSDGSFAA